VKQIGILLITFFCLLPKSGQAKLQRYTADFYKVRSAEYLNKDARLNAFSARFADAILYSLPGYTMIEVKTIYGGQHGGSMHVAVPTDEAITFKDKYSVKLEDANKLSGILRRASGERGYLYLEYGEGPSTQETIEEPKESKKTQQQTRPRNSQYSADYYELLAEEFIGQKITLPATSALLDKSDRLDHITNTKSFIVETPNNKIKDGRIAVVVPNEHVSTFAKIFMKNTKNEVRNLSGYLYKQKTKKTTFLFLYCSNEPLDLETQQPPAQQDYLHELIAIYMDLNDDGKDELIELARKLDSPE
jgi:hypothetical protein